MIVIALAVGPAMYAILVLSRESSGVAPPVVFPLLRGRALRLRADSAGLLTDVAEGDRRDGYC